MSDATKEETGEGVLIGREEAAALPDLDRARYLRLAFEVAEQSRAEGQHLFGAILVGPDGAVLMAQTSGFLPGRDMTGQAERVLTTRAGIAYGSRFLAGTTLYTSCEPRAKCATASYRRHRPGGVRHERA